MDPLRSAGSLWKQAEETLPKDTEANEARGSFLKLDVARARAKKPKPGLTGSISF